MLQWLNPTYFLGLLAILIPIAIHLWNKKPTRIVKVGSIQWLVGKEQQYATAIFLRQRLLLAVRVLLILAICALMASLVWMENKNLETKKMVLLDPSLEKAVVDSLYAMYQDDSVSVNWLAPGLLSFSDSSQLRQLKMFNTWSVLREVDSRTDVQDTVLVFIKGYLENVWGKRPEVSKTFQLVKMSVKPWQKVVKAIEEGDSIRIIIATGGEDRIFFLQKKIPVQEGTVKLQELVKELHLLKDKNGLSLRVGKEELRIEQQDTVRIAILAGKKQVENDILRKAFFAIEETLSIPVKVTKDAEQADVLVVLDKELKYTKKEKEGQTCLFLKKHTFGKQWLIASDSVPGQWQLQDQFGEALYDPQLLSRLVLELVPIILEEEELLKQDSRQLPVQQLSPVKSKEKIQYASNFKVIPLNFWLLLLCFLLLAIERYLARM